MAGGRGAVRRRRMQSQVWILTPCSHACSKRAHAFLSPAASLSHAGHQYPRVNTKVSPRPLEAKILGAILGPCARDKCYCAPEPPRKLIYFRSAEASNHNAKQPQSSDSSLEVWRRTLGIGCCKPGAERGHGRCICRLLIGWRPCASSSEKAHLL